MRFISQRNVGTLTPVGTISLDCGSQQTFTCSVPGPAALWTISGLSSISVIRESGLSVANTSGSRVTTTDTSGVTQSSTITITGFTTADHGGTIQCINLVDSSVQGMASISVGEWLFDRIHRCNIITQRALILVLRYVQEMSTSFSILALVSAL